MAAYINAQLMIIIIQSQFDCEGLWPWIGLYVWDVVLSESFTEWPIGDLVEG